MLKHGCEAIQIISLSFKACVTYGCMQAKLCKAAYIDGEERPTLRRRDVLTGTAGLAAAQVLSIGVAASGGMTPPAVAGSITPLEATELGHTGMKTFGMSAMK